VAICTHNRFDDLSRALEALADQTLSIDAFEVLIVDNSTDHAARDAFRTRRDFAPNVRWHESSPPSLSRARNTALSQASAPIVAFLDDDAVPVREWLDELSRAFCEAPEAAVVAGPIEAQWDMERPAWLPLRHEGALTVLDLGTESRVLASHEFGYGANLAVRRDDAVSVGGFDEALGRSGNVSLLSGEEVALQDSLREKGRTVYYAAGARVLHRMRPERLTRNWFRARMAWQAVSENTRDGGLRWPDWCRNEIRRTSKSLGVEHAVGTILSRMDGDGFSDQLDLIRHLFGLILASGSMPDADLESLLPSSNSDVPEESPDAFGPGSDAYRPAAAVQGGARVVFAEYANCHGYLFDLYGDLPDVALVELPGRAWTADPSTALSYLEASIPPLAGAVFFLTLDPFSFNPAAADALISSINRWKLPTFAVQHRLPRNAEERQTLARVAGHLTRVVALSDEIGTRLTANCNLQNVATILHHPSKFRHVLQGSAERTRRAVGARPDHTIMGMIGEAREGKGFELLLPALDLLPSSVRDSLFFLVAGKASGIDANEITDKFIACRIPARVDLRRTDDPDQFAVLTSTEYADAIAATDFGLLLYRGAQRDVASGVLSDYVWQRKRVIATRDSLVGAEVSRHGLGLTLDPETPEALAALMSRAVELRNSDAPLGSEFEHYRETHSPLSVLENLKALIHSATAEQVAA
jgi:GT2 family glycosyltransferase